MNVKANDGMTPFHFACRYGQLKCMKILMENGVKQKEGVWDRWCGTTLAFWSRIANRKGI